jgi:monoamine oxidase
MTRVAVIGAGFAGLAAADALAAAGLDVIVLEARDRVGGRVWSQALPDGSIIERGAEFILPDDSLVREVAQRFGLALFEKGTLYGDREPRGGPPVTRPELVAAFETVRSSVSSGDLRGRSVREVLDALPLHEGARAAILARVEVSTAYPADDQDASVLLEGATTLGDFATYSVVGGNQRIATALAAGLGDRIRLGTPIGRIAWSQGGARIPVAGVDLEVDRVVVAIPPTVLDAIAFDPPLPEGLADAHRAIRLGQAAKLFLPLPSPVPPSAVLSVPDRYWTFTQLTPSGGPLQVLGAFAGSAAALERLRIAEGPGVWAAAIRRSRAEVGLPATDDGIVLSTWHDDPWVLGAYSARSMTSPIDDAAVARPVGPLHFAGEHTAGAFHGLMEGALRSGMRAAEEIRGSIAR